ncbi:MAG: GNAT family N-acetyltransferase [Bacteroidales bacterium]|jgi:diamine N-acetyltransferase|nr:GNAT family N-acetyltransferase [Bacteroidales bacterium]
MKEKSIDIVLKALEPSDVHTLMQWENDRSIWTISDTIEPLSKYKLDTYIKQTLNFDVFGLRQLRLMVHKVEYADLDITEPIGTIDLFEFDPVHRHAGIGIMLLKAYQGQGVGRLVLDQFLDYVFETLQLHSVYANISETNINSIKFFESYGFLKVAEYKEFLCEEGGFVSQFTYQLIGIRD